MIKKDLWLGHKKLKISVNMDNGDIYIDKSSILEFYGLPSLPTLWDNVLALTDKYTRQELEDKYPSLGRELDYTADAFTDLSVILMTFNSRHTKLAQITISSLAQYGFK